MAVTPIRRASMGVVPAARAPAPMQSAAPSQQGWVWNGSNWVWDPDFCGSGWYPPFQCNYPPQCPVVPPSLPPLAGPIIGVTDGSDAAPGQVGEFIQGSASVSYLAYPTRNSLTASPLVVQPGDWDLWASMNFTTTIGLGFFQLSPTPTGVSSTMPGYQGVQNVAIGGTAEFAGIINGFPGRGNFSVPTLLAFQIIIDQSTQSALLAGTAQMVVNGRRRR